MQSQGCHAQLGRVNAIAARQIRRNRMCPECIPTVAMVAMSAISTGAMACFFDEVHDGKNIGL
jgi:hypothetical protein